MKFVLLVMSMLLSVAGVFSQSSDSNSFRLSSVDISSGRGAITSGIYVYGNFEKKTAYGQVTIGSNDVEATYLFRFLGDKLEVGPNGGYFFNMAYLGPQVILSPWKFISTFSWYGWAPGKTNGAFEKKIKKMFALNALTISIWRLKAMGCLIECPGAPLQKTATLRYTQSVSKTVDGYTEVGWDFLNKVQLLKIGFTWNQ